MNTLLAITVIAAASAALSPSQILSKPSSYDGQSVTVSGKVANLKVNKSAFRQVTGFQLCDSKCVVVIDETNASRRDGETATVSGTFQQSFKGPKRSYNNVILIH